MADAMAKPDGKRKPAARRPINVSLDSGLIEEAKRLGVNVSRACERGLAAQIAEERGRQWREENAEAIASYNAFVERNGVLLSEHRQF